MTLLAAAFHFTAMVGLIASLSAVATGKPYLLLRPRKERRP